MTITSWLVIFLTLALEWEALAFSFITFSRCLPIGIPLFEACPCVQNDTIGYSDFILLLLWFPAATYFLFLSFLINLDCNQNLEPLHDLNTCCPICLYWCFFWGFHVMLYLYVPILRKTFPVLYIISSTDGPHLFPLPTCFCYFFFFLLLLFLFRVLCFFFCSTYHSL